MPLILHLTFFGIAAFLVIFPTYQNPKVALIGCSLVAVGIALYYGFVRNNRLPETLKKINSMFITKLF